MPLRLAGIIIALAVSLAAQVRVTAVVNGASFQAPVAPRSFASIFGENLAPSTAAVQSLIWPTAMAGVTVTVNGKAVPLHSVSAGQINFQVPGDTAAGPATVVVSHGGQSSSPFSFEVAPAAPGILVFGGDKAVATKPDGSVITPDNPARPGSVIIVYMTGQGPVDNPVADGSPAAAEPLSRASLPYAASMGGRDAPVGFLGLSPGFVGLLQANITVPDLPQGNHPLIVTVGGRASNAPVVAVGGAPASLLTRIGGVDTGRGNVNIVPAGAFAYACGNGISVIDTADPSRPVFRDLVTTGSGVCHSSGNTLVAARGGNPASFTVHSLSNPALPVRVGGPLTTPLPFVGDFYITDTAAFFATLWFEFNIGTPNRIFRQHGELFSATLTDPSRPAIASTLRADSSNPASSNESPYFGVLGVNRDTLLLLSTTSTGADTTGGLGRLVVADISNPSDLRALSQMVVPRTATLNCGAINGSLALVAGNTSSWTSPGDFAIRGTITLSTVDLSDPRNPRVQATVVTAERNTFTAPACVSLGGGWFAMTATSPPEFNEENRIVLIDARDSGAPSVRGTVTLPMLSERGLAVSGDILYAATEATLQVYRINR